MPVSNGTNESRVTVLGEGDLNLMEDPVEGMELEVGEVA